VHVPYYSVEPGGTFDTEPLVRLPGGKDFPGRGAVAFPVVLMGKVTALDALVGWLDGDVDIVHRDKVRAPSVDDEQLQKINLQLMASSKQKAVGVAFEHLGYNAIHGQGALVAQVVKGAPSDGILAAGDVIVAVDGAPVAADTEVVADVGAHAPGTSVQLAVRDMSGSTRQVSIQLGHNPTDAARGYLGVSLQTSVKVDAPFTVDIDSEQIGGPSAGLAFTLEVLDRLTAGDLTGGHRIAATGTIELDGTVGRVGGVRQKTASVLAGGYDLFLVPKAEEQEARARAGSKLKVVGVATLDDALQALASLGGNGLALGTLKVD
jgi:PDZ domain-containing protein